MEQLQNLLKKFNELSMTKKIIILGLIMFLITSSIIFISYKGSGNYVALYYNVPMEQSGEIIEFLKKNRISYKIDDRTGTIKVPKSRVYEIRMMLAKSGIPGGSGVGFEIFDKTSFGVTEFVQKINYMRAVQGELARSIETIRGIKTARVHIVTPKESLFKDEQNPPTASVIITYEPGYSTLKVEQIKAIVNLVANSIEGLKPDNVVVLDNIGNVLTDKLKENEDITAGVQKKIEYKKRVENYYKREIQSMLEKVVGRGKVVVRVNADLDFTKIKETKEIFDPENVAERSHEKDVEKVYAQNQVKGGIPGVASNVPSVMVQQKKKGGSILPLAKNKEHEIVNYEVSKIVSHTEKPIGVIKRLSVAVLVDGTYKEVKKGKETVKEYIPRSPKEMEVFKEIVKKAIGFDPNRKDQIEIANVAFNYNEIEKLNKELKKEKLTSLIMMGVKYGLTILIIFIIFFFIIKPILKILLQRIQPPEVVTEIPKTVEEIERQILKREEEISEGVKEEFEVKKEKKLKPKDKIVKLLDEDPDKVVGLIKEWLRSRT